MNRGSTGYAGGGIYFAQTRNDTRSKAKNAGYSYDCLLREKLGNIKKIGGPDSTITYHSLLMEGYGFVEIHRVTGVEFVEYDSDQVSIRKVNKHFWLGESKHRTTHSSLK
jgi:hypothetical protein